MLFIWKTLRSVDGPLDYPRNSLPRNQQVWFPQAEDPCGARTHLTGTGGLEVSRAICIGPDNLLLKRTVRDTHKHAHAHTHSLRQKRRSQFCHLTLQIYSLRKTTNERSKRSVLENDDGWRAGHFACSRAPAITERAKRAIASTYKCQEFRLSVCLCVLR